MNKYLIILTLSLSLFSCTKDEEPIAQANTPPNEEENEEETNPDDSVEYNLPLLYINTLNNAPIDSKEDYIDAKLFLNGRSIYSNIISNIEIRGRGNSTWDLHPKKPYQIKLDSNQNFLSLAENDKWLLLAEYSDKTLVRNRTALKIGELSNLNWTPSCEYIEVYLNDAYNGLYLLTEKIEDSRNRLNIGDEGFLCEVDQDWRLKEGDVYFQSNNFLIVIKEPEVSNGDAKYNEIKQHIDIFETALYANFFTDPETGYLAFIDIVSFVDWYLINEMVKNQDSKDFSSIFFQYIPGGKITMGPIWDFDLAFGNVNYSDCEHSEGWWVKDHPWYSRLFEDEYFVELVKTRFNYFNDNRDFIISYIEEQELLLEHAQERNNNQWDLYGNYVWPNPVFFNSHAQEIEHLIDWYNDRMDWLEENLISL